MFDQNMADLLLMKGPEQTVVFGRKDLMFALNFHYAHSLKDVLVPIREKADYEVVMCSDDKAYGGQDLVEHMVYEAKTFDDQHFIQLYIPARTAIVLKEVPGTREKYAIELKAQAEAKAKAEAEAKAAAEKAAIEEKAAKARAEHAEKIKDK